MHNFGEKDEEYNAKSGGNVPVWKSPKYEMAKEKAIEIIDSGKYGVEDADFWILMNATKTGKMAYTGLIISHNGCLKINDALDSRFKPSCVSIDKDGFHNSLVYSYMNDEQGIYEVGEVSQTNCKNDYPYAMAFKRLFDRVVLKLSKLAYAGIYSDSESEEFKEQIDTSLKCSRCKAAVTDAEAKTSMAKYNKVFCPACLKKADEYKAKNPGWEIKNNEDNSK